jgi:hypothetical protein
MAGPEEQELPELRNLPSSHKEHDILSEYICFSIHCIHIRESIPETLETRCNFVFLFPKKLDPALTWFEC